MGAETWLTPQAISELKGAPAGSVRLALVRFDSVEVRNKGNRSESLWVKATRLDDQSAMVLTKYAQGWVTLKAGTSYAVAGSLEGEVVRLEAWAEVDGANLKAGEALLAQARSVLHLDEKKPEAKRVKLTLFAGGDETAKRYRPSKALVFEAQPPQLTAEGVFALAGTLSNPGEVDERVVVFADETALFVQPKLPAGVTWSPSAMRPPEPPAAHELLVRKHEVVRLEGVLDTTQLVYTGAPKITVEWTLMYWSTPRPHGEWELTLPRK